MTRHNTEKWIFQFYYEKPVFLISLLIFLFMISLSSAQAVLIPPHEMSSPVKVRVRIFEKKEKVTVRGFDLKISHFFQNRLSEWEIECQKGKIYFTHQAHKMIFPEPVAIVSAVGFLKLQGLPYREVLKIYSHENFCEVINEIGIEKYLGGLVNAEFSAKWNSDSVAAQVIAARTYAYYQILEAKKKPKLHYDVDSSIKDQLYLGFGREDFRASRAVEKTYGMILGVESDRMIKPIKAFYHSTCGGQTTLPENVWGRGYMGFNKRIPCPFCQSSPAFRWDEFLDSEDLKKMIQKGVQETGLPKSWPANSVLILREGELEDVFISKTDLSGKVIEVKLRFRNKMERVSLALNGNRLRSWIGTSRLKSTAFLIKPQVTLVGRGWFFEGRGNGHGVGLCQWGAKVMGEKGYKTASILKYYYPDTVLRKIW